VIGELIEQTIEWKGDEGCPYCVDKLLGQRNWKLAVQGSRFVRCDVFAGGYYKIYGLPLCDAV
jgi:hypothetical protein